MKQLTLLILFVFIQDIGFAQPQKIAFEKYGVAEGLPEEYITDLLQDDKGFIWFGTQNGLVKYDGYHFKVYKGSSDTTGLQAIKVPFGLIKSRDGKVWISGDLFGIGISSFDPSTERFRNYVHTDSTSKNIERNLNILLFEDDEANVWFKNFSGGTDQGVCRLNPATGVITPYKLRDINGIDLFMKNFGVVESSGIVWLLDNKSNLNAWNRQTDRFEIIIPAGMVLSSSEKADTIKQLSKGSGNRLLLTGRHGLYIFDSKTQKIVKCYTHTTGHDNGIADSISYAVEDFRGQFWVGHKHGIISLIDPATDSLQTFIYGSAPLAFQKGITEVPLFSVMGQNKEGIWFQAQDNDISGIFFLYYNLAKNTFSIYNNNFNFRNNPFPKYSYVPYQIFEDYTGLLWVYSWPNLYKQAPKKQQLTLFRKQVDEPNGLPSDSIWRLFEDSKKRLWVGTRNGLALYQPGEENFKVFRNDRSNAASLSNNWITTVQEDADGKIWVGTYNGLNLWQESTGSFKRFFYNSADKNNCAFLFNDKQHRLWLSIWGKGVFVLDKRTGRVAKSYVPDASNPASLSSKTIYAFYQDSRENIWLGDPFDNQFGLYRLNQAEDGFTHYLPKFADTCSISSNEIHFLAEDGKKRLWIATDEGLNLFDYERNRFSRFANFNIVSFTCFAPDTEGEPWFGTYSGGGLVSVDAEKGTISAYDETKGLLHNDLSLGSRGMIPKDDFGRFWLPTQRGLSVFDPENKSFVSYFERDGFQPYSRSYVSLKTSNGDIWIGGDNGLNHIVPDNLFKKDSTIPTIVITQVAINDSLYSKPDGTILKKSVAYTDDIKLKYWQKDLSFDFVALHYLRSEDNLYSWKLENYEKNWSVPSKERKASYTNLSHGVYVFRVKAANADGVWNEEGISFTVTISPPWWETWWAITIYTLLFLVSLRIFIRWRGRMLRHEKEQLQVKVEERTIELKKSLAELKSTQSQLIQSAKMASLGELTAGIAHEIQNPLNFVNNFSEVNTELIEEMKTELKSGNHEEVIALANGIAENEKKINMHGKRADSIVKGMLQHSRTSNGVKEFTDINVLADEFLRLSYHGLRAKDKSFNATMKSEFDSSIGKITIVSDEIGRVILNLLNNAFYAVSEKRNLTPEGYEPTVSISTHKVGDQVEIKVRDNGNGIPQNVLDKIFQPFFTTKPTGQGTGLGLSLAYDIVKRHGGELKVQTIEGEGSAFSICLPI